MRSSPAVLLCLFLLLTGAVPLRSMPEWRRDRAALERLLDEVAALEEATARLHNAIAVSGEQGRKVCATELGSLHHRAVLFGDAWQRRVARAEVAAAVLSEQASGPLIAPLLDREGRERLGALEREVVERRVRVDEAASWAHRYVEPCAWPLVADPGFERAPTELSRRAVALIGVGGGRICPGDHPADGTVVVVERSEACYGDTTCRCALQPVRPAAVLAAP